MVLLSTFILKKANIFAEHKKKFGLVVNRRTGKDKTGTLRSFCQLHLEIAKIKILRWSADIENSVKSVGNSVSL